MSDLLTEQTLKIVIAVICIGFLVGFLVSLYFNSTKSQNLEFAESSLNFLVKEIKAGQTSVEIYNPKGWTISSWPFEKKIPNLCSNRGWENCICICETPLLGDFVETCDKKGICLENDFEVEDKIKIEILEINYEQGIINKNEL